MSENTTVLVKEQVNLYYDHEKSIEGVPGKTPQVTSDKLLDSQFQTGFSKAPDARSKSPATFSVCAGYFLSPKCEFMSIT